MVARSKIVNKPLQSGGWLAMIEDITARTRVDEKIAHMAHYDALTDLPNRVLFRERLEQALKAIRPGEQLAIMYIDIDEFKSVNDALGHPIGDELLKNIADRLRACLRERDVAARLGGDEFAVFQTVVRSQSDITQRARDTRSVDPRAVWTASATDLAMRASASRWRPARSGIDQL